MSTLESHPFTLTMVRKMIFSVLSLLFIFDKQKANDLYFLQGEISLQKRLCFVYKGTDEFEMGWLLCMTVLNTYLIFSRVEKMIMGTFLKSSINGKKKKIHVILIILSYMRFQTFL